jgi:hypothetical protein
MIKLKAPRIYHLPWSEVLSADDKRIRHNNMFDGKDVVVTVKYDGSNISLYNDGSFHSRSLNSSRQHESNDYLHSWWANKLYSDMYVMAIYSRWPNLRLVGENMCAVHTISYNNLEDVFLLHSAWNGTTCLSWKDTLNICFALNITSVPVLYKGPYNEAKIKCYNTLDKYRDDVVEGYVVRSSNSYEYNQSDFNIAKFVSNRFIIKDDKHWALNGLKRNKIKAV